jgi:nucleotide-binding universal stress UspA family protein
MSETPYPAVIVGTDGSTTAARAVRRAAIVATTIGAPLKVASGYERARPEDFGPPSQTAGISEEELWANAYRGALETAENGSATARGVAQGSVEAVAAPGEPAEALLQFAERREGALLVVGNKGMTSSSRFVLGNVPNKISHHAVGDVLIVRTTDETEAAAPTRMLVTTDGSPTAARAVERAVALAGAFQASLTALSVDPDRDRAGEALDAAAKQAEAGGVSCERMWESGDPADAIIEASAGFDLTVVGNKGMTGAGRFVLGSVPNKISHHIDTDLLIVKTDAA